ncbi:MAG: response regulator transcription factor [Desulfobacterales bacterium]|nr:response regulator transcription factor [Desulfobacterales bacterium]
MNSNDIQILIIDDDEGLQALLAEYFSHKGIRTSHALTGREGLTRLTGIDVVILDLMMPEMDGLETLRRIRQMGNLPVIMLTALEDETDRIVGLEMGADDYVHKPINPRELLARIKSIVRRTRAGQHPLEPEPTNGISIDAERRMFAIDGKAIDLTQVEFDILQVLVQANGRIITRDRLMDLTRGRDFEAYDRSIDVHISRIRKKIEKNPSEPERIKTVWGKGYKWDGELL